MAYLGNDLQVAFPVYRNIDDISGSFNSVLKTFPLTVSGVAPVPAPLYSQQCLISVAGVVQRPDDSGLEGFRLSGGNIIFASAPTTGADFFGVILAGADYVNAGGNFPSGTAAVPSITFNDDLDTGIYNSGTNQVSITTGGSERLRIDSAGQVESVSLGTATAPAFSFTTDPNTGIYSPGADQVAISTGGSGRLFVDASGSISTSSTAWQGGPVYQLGGLQIGASTYAKAVLQTGGTSRAEWFFDSADNYLQAKSGGFYIGNTTANPIGFSTNGSERLRITSAGLVGVGTSAPVAALDVNGRIAVVAGTVGTPSYHCNTDTNTGINLPEGDRIQFVTGGVEAVRIDSSQRVGVGTTVPSGRLDVETASDTYVNFSTTNNGSAAGICLIGNNNNEFFGYANNLRFATVTGKNAAGFNERMRLDSSGRLGIGTSTPVSGAQLTVAGSALAVTGQNLDHSANSIRIGQEGSGAAQIRCYGPNTSTNGSLTFKMSRSDGTNSQDVVIDGSGKLGIGTSPAKKLDVYEGSAGNVEQYLRNTTINLLSKIEGTTSAQFGTETSHPLLLLTGNSERARIDSSGRLLVGTSTAPTVGVPASATFVVQGYAGVPTGDSLISLQRGQAPASISSGAQLGAITFGANDGSPYAQIHAATDGAGGTNDYPGRLVFSVTRDGQASPTEAHRISSIGLQYSLSTDDVFRASTTQSAGTSFAVFRGFHSGTANVSGMGTNTSIIWSNGNIQNTNNSYTAISDIKLKENIVDANSQWDDLKALRVRNYNLKEGQTHTQIGLVAQEVEPISPGLVYESPDRDAEGNDLGTVTKSVNYSVLYMKAVKALQEAMERIETLEAKVTALETP